MRFKKYLIRIPRGFTLVELLTVITIISLLATIIMVSISGAKAKSRDSRRVADIKSIQLALSLYYNDHGFYPTNIYAASDYQASQLDPRNGLKGTYLPSVPSDPGFAPNCTNTTATDKSCYQYIALTATAGACNTSNQPTRYHIGALMEDANNQALTQDADAAANASGFTNTCNSGGGTVDFSGLSAGSGNRCDATAGTGQPGGTELCYDQTP